MRSCWDGKVNVLGGPFGGSLLTIKHVGGTSRFHKKGVNDQIKHQTNVSNNAFLAMTCWWFYYLINTAIHVQTYLSNMTSNKVFIKYDKHVDVRQIRQTKLQTIKLFVKHVQIWRKNIIIWLFTGVFIYATWDPFHPCFTAPKPRGRVCVVWESV